MIAIIAVISGPPPETMSGSPKRCSLSVSLSENVFRLPCSKATASTLPPEATNGLVCSSDNAATDNKKTASPREAVGYAAGTGVRRGATRLRIPGRPGDIILPRFSGESDRLAWTGPETNQSPDTSWRKALPINCCRTSLIRRGNARNDDAFSHPRESSYRAA